MGRAKFSCACGTPRSDRQAGGSQIGWPRPSSGKRSHRPAAHAHNEAKFSCAYGTPHSSRQAGVLQI